MKHKTLMLAVLLILPVLQVYGGDVSSQTFTPPTISTNWTTTTINSDDNWAIRFNGAHTLTNQNVVAITAINETTHELFLFRSEDEGANWEYIQIFEPALDSGHNAVSGVSPNGTFVVFARLTDGDIHHAASYDDGLSWTTNISTGASDNEVLGDITFLNDTFYGVAADDVSATNQELYIRTLDGGATFSNLNLGGGCKTAIADFTIRWLGGTEFTSIQEGTGPNQGRPVERTSSDSLSTCSGQSWALDYQGSQMDFGRPVAFLTDNTTWGAHCIEGIATNCYSFYSIFVGDLGTSGHDKTKGMNTVAFVFDDNTAKTNWWPYRTTDGRIYAVSPVGVVDDGETLLYFSDDDGLTWTQGPGPQITSAGFTVSRSLQLSFFLTDVYAFYVSSNGDLNVAQTGCCIFSVEPETTTPPPDGGSLFGDDGTMFGGNKSALAEALQIDEPALEVLMAVIWILIFTAIGFGATMRPFGAGVGAIFGLGFSLVFSLMPIWFLVFVLVVSVAIGFFLFSRRGTA